MQLSHSSALAVMGLLYLSQSENGQIRVDDIAEERGVSVSYMAKIFQKLARKGIVGSTRGCQGGYFLSKGLEEITVKEVVEAVEGEIVKAECPYRSGRCPQKGDCGTFRVFNESYQEMDDYLGKKKLSELMKPLSCQ